MDITQEGRKELWGFAVGDRVKVRDDVPLVDESQRFGKITWIGGCNISRISENCRDRCSIVQYRDIHSVLNRIPPGELEHAD